MRGVFVLLLAIVAIEASQLDASRGLPEDHSFVTIQIHDYEHLPPAHLSRASDIVSRIYDTGGVRIEWLGVLRPDTRRTRGSSAQPGGDGPAAPVTLIILTAAMTARARIPDDVLGYAAVPADGGMGRIAYVMYDRIRRVAATGPAREAELLGFVMAHETGHLLLGRGSGTETGLMKCHWDRRGAQLLEPLKLQLTQLQAASIHRRLGNASPLPRLADGDTGAAADALPAPER